MKILIVDDESLARDRLKRMLAEEVEAGIHKIVGEAANGTQALSVSEEVQPELVLLDIRMPGMDGLETARHFLELESPPAVLFCTAYEEHAIAAFDLQAVGYLLKPVRKEKLKAAIAQAVTLNRAQLAALSAQDESRRSHISARTHKGLELIPVQDIYYFQADQKYVTVRYAQGEIIVDETLRELEDEFADLFVRVHRNALVSKAKIDGLVKENMGQVKIRLKDVPDTIDVSRRHLPAVRKLVKAL